jgi:hypothetical protein
MRKKKKDTPVGSEKVNCTELFGTIGLMATPIHRGES